MLALTTAALAFSTAPMAGRSAVGASRTAGVEMNRKVWAFDQDGVFEGREVSIARPPVKILSRVGELQAATALAESGLLSAAEEAGVFSKLEKAGAFSLAEKALPLVEKLGLLSTFERLVNVDNGLIFTGANTLLFFPIGLFALQICAFVPLTTGNVPATVAEVGVDLACLVSGATLWATAYAISLLQDA